MKFIKKYRKCLFAFIAIVIIVFSSMISVFANSVQGPLVTSRGSLSCPPLIFDAIVNNKSSSSGSSVGSHFTISDVAVTNVTNDYYDAGYTADTSLLNINDSYYQVDNTLKRVPVESFDYVALNQYAGSISYQHLVSFATRGSQVSETPSSIFSPIETALSVNDFYSWSGFVDDSLELDTEYLSSGSQFSIQFFNLDPNLNLMPSKIEVFAKQLGADDVSIISIMEEDYEELGITDYNFKFDYPFWFRSGITIDDSLPFVFQVKECIFYFYNGPTGGTYNNKFQISFKSSYDFDPRFTGLYNLDFDYLNPDPSVPVYPQDDFPLMPFANWLGGAVSGFLDLQLFPGFTLGGIFVTIFAFTCVVWFLKLVAGG